MTESTTPPLSGKLLAVARYAQEAVTVGESRSRLEEFQRIATPAAVEQALTSTLAPADAEWVAVAQSEFLAVEAKLQAAEAKALTMERALEKIASEGTGKKWDGDLGRHLHPEEIARAALRPIGDQSVSDGKELGLSRIGGETGAASVASDLTGPDSPGAER